MGLFYADLHLVLHQFPGMGVAGDIADGEVDAFFYDHLIAADIGEEDLILALDSAGALIFCLDRVDQDLSGLFRKGKEAQLGIIKNALDKMELDQHFLLEQLGAVKEDLVILQIVDILQLEGGHTCLPDHLAGGGSERDILGCNDGIGQIRGQVFLGQHLMGEVQMILVNKTPVKAFPLLVKVTVTIVRVWKYLVLQGLFHNTKLC
jgi:hypothetical protein